MKPLIIIGSSYHAGVIVDTLRALTGEKVIGFLDDLEAQQTMKHGFPVLGTVFDANRYTQHDFEFFMAVGDNEARETMRSHVRAEDSRFPNIIHPRAYVSPRAQLGHGNFIGAGAVVQPGCRVGDFCIINSGVVLEHDSRLGNFVHLAPGVATGGLVQVGDLSFVGVGASIRDRVVIGKDVTIGMGSVVVKDVADNFIGCGNPCKSLA